jgi:glycosyltransferase involved in cell wall biosynthesis
MKKLVSVSVVVPAYRASATIGDALQSVLQQSAPPREVLVVDDGSDDTEMLERVIQETCYRAPFDVRVSRSPVNRGPAAARNIGWNLASPESAFVAFLDADDRWEPNKLLCQETWMRAHPHVAWTAHRCAVASRGHHTAPPWEARPLRRFALLASNPVATPAVMIARRVPTRFRERLRYCEDLMLWIDLLDQGFPGAILEETLATLGRKPLAFGGLTGDLRAMHEGVLEVLSILAAEGRLAPLDHMLLQGWESVRYVRRKVLRLRG